MGNELAGQVAQRRRGGNGQEAGGQGGESRGGEVEPVRTLEQQIRRMAPEYEAAMPKGREAVQLIRDAITCVRTVRHLDECRPDTVLGALMTCAQLDLRPGVLGHAWPLPFWDGRERCYKAQLVIGYQGYVELGYRSGKILDLVAPIVRVGEEFEFVRCEDGDHLTHRPSLDGTPGQVRCFYSRARLVGGGYSLTDPMSLAAMEAHRDEHAPRDKDKNITGPWSGDFPAMGQKTMVLRNFKLLPKSEAMSIAMDADGGVRVDLTPGANAAEVTERTPQIIPGDVEPAGEQGAGT